jgi:type III pantothenate kinase
VLFGAADAADGMIRRIFREWPNPAPPRIVATGGLAAIVAPHTELIREVNPDLTLVGLRIAARHLGLPR